MAAEGQEMLKTDRQTEREKERERMVGTLIGEQRGCIIQIWILHSLHKLAIIIGLFFGMQF